MGGNSIVKYIINETYYSGSYISAEKRRHFNKQLERVSRFENVSTTASSTERKAVPKDTSPPCSDNLDLRRKYKPAHQLETETARRLEIDIVVPRNHRTPWAVGSGRKGLNSLSCSRRLSRFYDVPLRAGAEMVDIRGYVRYLLLVVVYHTTSINFLTCLPGEYLILEQVLLGDYMTMPFALRCPLFLLAIPCFSMPFHADRSLREFRDDGLEVMNQQAPTHQPMLSSLLPSSLSGIVRLGHFPS